jgi:predicted flap endonuclease-1-like 5' DNA nuclease
METSSWIVEWGPWIALLLGFAALIWALSRPKTQIGAPPAGLAETPVINPVADAMSVDLGVAPVPTQVPVDIDVAVDRPAVHDGPPDNLLLLKGVGPKVNAILMQQGVTRFDQIAAWTADDVARIDAHLGAFKGRIERDNWIEQAKLLAAGAIADFEAKFGKLDRKVQ